MINILIPLAGKNQFFPEAEYPFPKPLIEFNGKTMIEHIIDNFSSIQKEKQFIFIVNSEDCKKYHLDNVLNILTNHTCKIIKLDNETKGAACSAMMAVEYIDNDTPLIISNADQLFDICLDEVINSFERSKSKSSMKFLRDSVVTPNS
jgi:NDP-sugar pyrophosphorylase family protein